MALIAIRICALVKLARERELEVNVESDYLPEPLASTSARQKAKRRRYARKLPHR